jgi:hypothetical protein
MPAALFAFDGWTPLAAIQTPDQIRQFQIAADRGILRPDDFAAFFK